MDSQWHTFAEVCKERFSECGFQEQLISQCGGNSDVAWATFFHLGNDALSGLSRSIPALDNEVPVKLIREGQSDRVRHVLWRMPC